MNDADMRFYLSLLWRRAPWLALAAASITAIGIAVAYMLPPVYRAGAKILVEAPQIPSELARSTVPADPWQQVQIVQEKLTTRENLLDFARRLDIYGSRAARLSDDDIVDDMRARTTIEQIQPAAPEQGASMFTVSFDARRPDLAARVANEFVSVILDKNVSLRTDRASDTLQFFTGEVARLGRELTGIEAGILKFKNANEGALPDSIDFRRTQQSNQQERLLMLEREESALRTRRINLLRAFEATVDGSPPAQARFRPSSRRWKTSTAPCRASSSCFPRRCPASWRCARGSPPSWTASRPARTTMPAPRPPPRKWTFRFPR